MNEGPSHERNALLPYGYTIGCKGFRLPFYSAACHRDQPKLRAGAKDISSGLHNWDRAQDKLAAPPAVRLRARRTAKKLRQKHRGVQLLTQQMRSRVSLACTYSSHHGHSTAVIPLHLRSLTLLAIGSWSADRLSRPISMVRYPFKHRFFNARIGPTQSVRPSPGMDELP